MDSIAKFFPRLQKFFWNTGVLVGFGGMIFILYYLIKETLKLLLVPGTPPALAPVLPGVQIPGAPALSFWHWIVTILIAATVHEFSHGIAARLHKIPVKSSGFAFLGPILAAFVEPDEKVVPKKKPMQQLAMFAAGPFSNIILGMLILLVIVFISTPFLSGFYQGSGIGVAGVTDGFPAELSGIEAPFTITQINGEDTLTIVQFLEITENLEPGDELTLATEQGDYTMVSIENPDDPSKAHIGINGLTQINELKPEHENKQGLFNILQWVDLLLFWLFVINIGIGLFNLLPLGPVDGGRMFHTLALVIFKNEGRANQALNVISFICLALIVINMIPWITQLLTWIWSGVILII